MSIFLISVTVLCTGFHFLCLNYNFGQEEEEEVKLTTKAKVLGSRTSVLCSNFAILFFVMKTIKMATFDDPLLGCANRHNKSSGGFNRPFPE